MYFSVKINKENGDTVAISKNTSFLFIHWMLFSTISILNNNISGFIFNNFSKKYFFFDSQLSFFRVFSSNSFVSCHSVFSFDKSMTKLSITSIDS